MPCASTAHVWEEVKLIPTAWKDISGKIKNLNNSRKGPDASILHGCGLLFAQRCCQATVTNMFMQTVHFTCFLYTFWEQRCQQDLLCIPQALNHSTDLKGSADLRGTASGPCSHHGCRSAARQCEIAACQGARWLQQPSPALPSSVYWLLGRACLPDKGAWVAHFNPLQQAKPHKTNKQKYTKRLVVGLW